MGCKAMQLTLLYKQWIDGYLYVRGVACSERMNQLISAVPLSSMNESFTVFSLFQAVAALYTCSASRSTEFGKLLNKTVCLQLYLWDIYHVVVLCPLLAKKTKECCFKQTQSCTSLNNVLGAFFFQLHLQNKLQMFVLFTACVIISLLVSLALLDFVAAVYLLCSYFDEHMQL